MAANGLPRRFRERADGSWELNGLMYGAIAPPFVALETYRWNTATLKAGKTVELADGTFLQIEAVIQNLATDEVTLRGLIFKRCTAFEGEFKRDVNEVAAVFVVQLDDPRSEKEQNLMQVRLEQVVKLRKLVVTNYPSPVHRYNKDDVPPATTDEKMKYIRDNESLATRWKHVTYFENAQQRKANRTSRNNFHFRKIVSVTRDECSLDMHLDPDTLKYAWRGETTIGGAGGRQDNVPRDLGHSVDDDDMLIDEIRSSPPTLRPDGRKYTFIDVFCGCGGATCGANLAGFHIKLGVDIDRSAGESWQRNNPDAKFYHMSAQDFCRLGDLDGGLIADVVHLSFPCQFFSPAHTRAGPNDVANAIVVTVLEKILKLTKPRIVTLEETDGLLRRHRDYFNGMVETFTKLGFSISWQMVNMVNFGVPQSRKRLIMVAACPGESLPGPLPITHSKNGVGGLKPFATPRSFLANIPGNAENHNPKPPPANGNPQPWTDTEPIGTVCTGDSIPHPDGTRFLTAREVAALMTFPNEYVFKSLAKDVRTQIGNGVPPLFAYALFVHVRKHLEKADGIVREVEVMELD